MSRSRFKRSWPRASPVVAVPTGSARPRAWSCRGCTRTLEEVRFTNRLFYCLPMRVLVEQTHRRIEAMVAAAGLDVAVHKTLGGAVVDNWADAPDQPTIIVGTVDAAVPPVDAGPTVAVDEALGGTERFADAPRTLADHSLDSAPWAERRCDSDAVKSPAAVSSHENRTSRAVCGSFGGPFAVRAELVRYTGLSARADRPSTGCQPQRCHFPPNTEDCCALRPGTLELPGLTAGPGRGEGASQRRIGGPRPKLAALGLTLHSAGLGRRGLRGLDRLA